MSDRSKKQTMGEVQHLTKIWERLEKELEMAEQGVYPSRLGFTPNGYPKGTHIVDLACEIVDMREKLGEEFCKAIEKVMKQK